MTRLARHLVFLLLTCPVTAVAQEQRCDFSKVPGVVWWGTETQLQVSRVAAYLAPILWFSPDEPSLEGARGPDIRVPEVFPGESVPARPVLYYQIDQLFTRPDAPGAGIVRDPAGPAQDLLDVANTAVFMVTFFAYFSTEEGLGAHPHDIEPVEFRVTIIPHTWEGFEEWIPGGAQCTQPTYVMGVTRVTGKAHGLIWFWNVLDVDVYTELPMHLLVEEGKHALATDKNGDGVFTKGYDVNRRVNDAWGTRDIIRTGTLFAGGYEAWMAKVRRPEHRIFPPLPEDSPLQRNLRHDMEGGRYAVYELRPFPPASIAGEDRALRHLMTDKEVANWPEESELDDIERWGQALEEGAVLKSLSIALRADGNLGVSWVFPFFIVKHLEDPMTGGYILQRMYLTDAGRDFGWMALYTPSASRWLDTYLAAGGERDAFTDPASGQDRQEWDFVFETGLKFRVNVSHTPLKFLTFFTDYWGFRAGIKNRGFFDIDKLTYVLEFGAGSF